MITLRTSKDMTKILENYMDKNEIPNFLNEMYKLKGTNNAFKLVFKDMLNLINKNKKQALDE